MTTPDLGLLFNSAGHAVDSELTAKLAELGTTPRVICVLGKALGQELTQSRLGELAGLDKTTMVVTMDELERAGLAERRPSATDRRARIVAVTPQGAKVAKQSQRIVDRVHGEALGSLGTSEREALLRAMSRLVNGYLAEPAGAAPATARRARQRT
jgi:MarR family transcriptional regulator for hemolysin